MRYFLAFCTIVFLCCIISCNGSLWGDTHDNTIIDVIKIEEVVRKVDTVEILTNLKEFSDSDKFVGYKKYYLIVGKFPEDSAKIDSLVFNFLDTCQAARKFITRHKNVTISFHVLDENLYKDSGYIGEKGEGIKAENQIAIVGFKDSKLSGGSYSTTLNLHSISYLAYYPPIDRLHLALDNNVNQRNNK